MPQRIIQIKQIQKISYTFIKKKGRGSKHENKIIIKKFLNHDSILKNYPHNNNNTFFCRDNNNNNTCKNNLVEDKNNNKPKTLNLIYDKRHEARRHTISVVLYQLRTPNVPPDSKISYEFSVSHSVWNPLKY